MSNSETTAAIQRGTVAAEQAVMGYTRPDGTYVQGAVNFWDDSVESGELIASDVLAAALDVEEIAASLRDKFQTGPSATAWSLEVAAAVRDSILGGAS